MTDPAVDAVFARSIGSDSWSSAASAEVLADWEKLFRLNKLLATHGPSDLWIRKEVREGASEICRSVSSEARLSKDRLFQFADATELIIDLGSDGGVSLQQIEAQLGSLVHFYDRQGESIYLCRALLKVANACRHNKDEDAARQLIRYAFNIIYAKRHLTKPTDQLVFMEAAIWDLRMRPWDIEANSRELLLEKLMEKIGTPTARLNGTRELTAHWRRRKDADKANYWGEKLVNEPAAGDCPPIVGPTLVRPRIELLFDEGKQDKRKREQAIELIRHDYQEQYEREKRVLPYRQLLKWSDRFGLDLNPSLPNYESPMIFHLPRGCGVA